MGGEMWGRGVAQRGDEGGVAWTTDGNNGANSSNAPTSPTARHSHPLTPPPKHTHHRNTNHPLPPPQTQVNTHRNREVVREVRGEGQRRALGSGEGRWEGGRREGGRDVQKGVMQGGSCHQRVGECCIKSNTHTRHTHPSLPLPPLPPPPFPPSPTHPYNDTKALVAVLPLTWKARCACRGLFTGSMAIGAWTYRLCFRLLLSTSDDTNRPMRKDPRIFAGRSVKKAPPYLLPLLVRQGAHGRLGQALPNSSAR